MTKATSNPSSEGLGAQEATDKIEALLGGQPDASEETTEQPSEASSEEEQGTSETETPVEAASDEDAAPEAEATQEEPESEDGQPDENKSEEEPFFPVQMGDKEVLVPLSELKSGYLRHSDYTKKVQETAEERKTAQAETASAQQERQLYSQLLGQLKAGVEATMPQEPDWEGLLAQDPSECWRQQAIWNERTKKLNAVSEEQARVQELNEIEAQKALAAHLDKASAWLAEQLPVWRDPKSKAAEMVKIREYGKKSGYTEQELARAYDPRAIVNTWKAMKYDELMANKPKPATSQKGPQALRPGQASTQPTSKRAAIDKGKQRLARTGRPQDAVSIIEQLLS